MRSSGLDQRERDNKQCEMNSGSQQWAMVMEGTHTQNVDRIQNRKVRMGLLLYTGKYETEEKLREIQ